MLILSRRTDESIVIGDEVTITILSVKGKQVRIGIDAPPNVSVHREEIYRKIRDGEEPAAGDAAASGGGEAETSAGDDEPAPADESAAAEGPRDD